MYGDDREILKNTFEMVEENNRILHKMQRSARWHRFFSVIKWLVILLLAGGTYYYLQPYVDQVTKVYNQLAPIATSTARTLGSFLPDFSHYFR